MSLRCFESAAKHLSFTQAAQELFITQAAVSQHIRKLEDQLDVSLFIRHNRRLTLTEQGHTLLPYVSQSLTLLSDGLQKATRGNSAGPLNISALPSFCSRWLVPKLWHFSQQHPDIEVRLTPSLQVVDLPQSDFDLAIRFGLGNYKGCQSEALMSDSLFPGCSPKLLQTRPITQIAELANVPIIHDFLTNTSNWPAWLEAAGYPDLKITNSLRISDASLAITAALSGQGVTLARQSLVGEEINNGQLVRLFDTSIASDYGYYLVTPNSRPLNHKGELFRAWLIEQIAADSSLSPPQEAAVSLSPA